MSLNAAYKSPWLNEELEILQSAVAKFYEKEFQPHVDRWDEQGCVDRDAWLKAGEAGILCASIKEEYGGGGGNFAHEMVIAAPAFPVSATPSTPASSRITSSPMAPRSRRRSGSRKWRPAKSSAPSP
jgi:alkylation response protein AidB-like acyl-CoA dehydrogenase